MPRTADLRVGQWLGLGFGAAALLLLAAVALAVALLDRMGERELRQSRYVAPRAGAVQRVETELLRVGITARSHALAKDEPSLAAYADARARLRAARAELERFPKEPDGARIEVELLPLLEGYEQAADALMAAVARRAPAEELQAAQLVVSARRGVAADHLREYGDLLARKTAEAGEALEALRRRATWTLLVASAALLALLAGTAHLVGRGVRRPVERLVEASRRLAAGDHPTAAALAEPGEGAPGATNELAELGRAFGQMALELQDREARIGAQNEELQAQNEELQLQGEELQAQNEELQAQQEELQSQARELREQGDRLRESEERHRHLFEHLSEGFALHEMIWGPGGEPADYRFIDVNPAFERLTGLPRERAVGATVRALLPDLEPEWLERYGEVVRTRKPARFQGFSAALGRHFEVVAFSPEEGQFATLFFDVTERRAAEEALRQADRAKDEFLAVLSHELRNPLAPVVSGLHIVARAEPGSEESRRARAVIERQVGHLVRLVDDLLDVTRISRGKVQLRKAPLDLAALVRQASEDCSSIFAERGVTLDIDAGRELRVDADAARLTQILGNLLQNAAKFTPAGGRVTVSAGEERVRAVIRVRDTGIGIAPEVLPRLFQPFVQAESSLARTRGGLGLGLALVKGFVELHGGTVRAASEGEGRGAEFTVELPLEGVVTPALRPRPPAATPGLRVLVVEDNVDAADSLADVLRLGGHEVGVAYDGVEGLRLAQATRPEVVLCDVGLPGLDGYEVARRLRADGADARVLLVALTGYALPDDLRRAREAGFDAHLTKPARPEEIEAVLARASRVPVA
jgi:PAS domain S-box-containing protein